MFVSWPKLPVVMVLGGEFYCSDAKSAGPVEGLVVFDGPAIMNSPIRYSATSL